MPTPPAGQPPPEQPSPGEPPPGQPPPAQPPRSPRSLGELIRLLEGRGMLRTLLAAPGISTALPEVRGVEHDSRGVEAGDLFVAMSGENFDGHDFAAKAVARGAVAVVAERALPRLGVPQLLVAQARPTLALAAAWVNGFPSLDLGVVGITGTDGKTTTAYLVRSMLDACGLPAGLISTVEVVAGGQSLGYTGYTTPESTVVQADLARMVAAGDRFAVVESTSHGLALDRVAEIAYDVAVLTNVTHEHLDLHGTHEAYRAAKRRLFEWLAVGKQNPEKGHGKTAVINGEDRWADEFLAAARAAGARVLTYAAGAKAGANDVDAAAGADIRALAVRETTDGLAIRVHTPRWEETVTLHLIGHFNVYNALAAVGVGEALDLDPERMRRGLAALPSVPGRMQRIDAGQDFAVFVDFAHTPGALAAALDALAPLAAARGGGLISVFGSPGARDTEKRPMMGRAAGERSRIVVLTDDDPRDEDRMQILDQIAPGAEEAGRRRDHDLFLIPDRAAAIRRAMELARPSDVVLLAGKGHEPSLATADGPVPWDEESVARSALAALGYGDAG